MVLAEALEQFRVWHQRQYSPLNPRSPECLRIFDSDLPSQVPEVDPLEPFCEMQRVTVRPALAGVQPASVAEAGRVDDERIPIPRADGITHPRGLRIHGQWPSISQHLSKRRSRHGRLVEKDGDAGRLDNLERIHHGHARISNGVAVPRWIIHTLAALTLLLNRGRPWRHLYVRVWQAIREIEEEAALEAAAFRRPAFDHPDARQIRFAIRS